MKTTINCLETIRNKELKCRSIWVKITYILHSIFINYMRTVYSIFWKIVSWAIRRREALSRQVKLIHISRAGSFISSLSISTKLMSPTIRDLKMLESSDFHKNVDLSSFLSKFISDFENPSRKTRERNYKHCVRLFERTIKASNLRFAAKCRH